MTVGAAGTFPINALITYFGDYDLQHFDRAAKEKDQHFDGDGCTWMTVGAGGTSPIN